MISVIERRNACIFTRDQKCINFHSYELLMRSSLIILSLICHCQIAMAQEQKMISWPEGNEIALSLTFDDGRESQVINGTPLFDEFGIKATFYVLPSAVERKLPEWKTAVKSGHEIGNHSRVHPCSGNFLWARKNALE